MITKLSEIIFAISERFPVNRWNRLAWKLNDIAKAMIIPNEYEQTKTD